MSIIYIILCITQNKYMISLQKENIIKLYQDGYSMESISLLYGCSRNPIEKLLKSNNVATRIGKKKVLTNEQELQVCKLYNENKTIRELSSIFNCSNSVIIRIFKENNLISRKTGPKIKYIIDNNFFKEINCEANAYFLGLMYADGHISKNLNYMNIHLQSGDIDILEKFRDLISPNYKIKKDKNGYIFFQICQTDIVKQLISLGCVPQKSLILKFPTCISDNLIHHFLRGYFDGDGCISFYTKNNHKRYSWDIVSTDYFCHSVEKIIKSQLNINCSFRYCGGEKSSSKGKITTSRITIGGNNQVEVFLDWLYKDATIYLQRKHDKYLEFKNFRKGK